MKKKDLFIRNWQKSNHSKYPIVGSWVIGGESCGIGIRETDCKITNNMSYFIPHIITNDIKDLNLKQIN